MSYADKVRADTHFFKYGNPDVIIHQPKYIGHFVNEMPRWSDPFFKDTPELWIDKNVLDLGSGGPENRLLLQELYPTINYTGVDLFDRSDPESIKADATNTIPFMGLKFGKEFDTVTCLGFNPSRFFGLFGGGYGHLKKYLNESGHVVFNFIQARYTIDKSIGICVKASKSFKITEERTYPFRYTREDRGSFMNARAHYLICTHKKE